MGQPVGELDRADGSDGSVAWAGRSARQILTRQGTRQSVDHTTFVSPELAPEEGDAGFAWAWIYDGRRWPVQRCSLHVSHGILRFLGAGGQAAFPFTSDGPSMNYHATVDAVTSQAAVLGLP